MFLCSILSAQFQKLIPQENSKPFLTTFGGLELSKGKVLCAVTSFFVVLALVASYRKKRKKLNSSPTTVRVVLLVARTVWKNVFTVTSIVYVAGRIIKTASSPDDYNHWFDYRDHDIEYYNPPKYNPETNRTEVPNYKELLEKEERRLAEIEQRKADAEWEESNNIDREGLRGFGDSLLSDLRDLIR
jgi:hypothetical protein